jgi:hypothetical protein
MAEQTRGNSAQAWLQFCVVDFATISGACPEIKRDRGSSCGLRCAAPGKSRAVLRCPADPSLVGGGCLPAVPGEGSGERPGVVETDGE